MGLPYIPRPQIVSYYHTMFWGQPPISAAAKLIPSVIEPRLPHGLGYRKHRLSIVNPQKNLDFPV